MVNRFESSEARSLEILTGPELEVVHLVHDAPMREANRAESRTTAIVSVLPATPPASPPPPTRLLDHMAGLEELLIGRVLGSRYRLDALIGRGGMGTVFQGMDLRLERAVAVKILGGAEDPATVATMRARFLREAKAAASLRDPHVVQVHDYGSDTELDLDYLVMELLEGRDLATAIHDYGGALRPELGISILIQAAEGLAAGHRKQVVHRDVKPGNLFLVEEAGRFTGLRLLDFGIAQPPIGDQTVEKLTAWGPGPQSPRFASPEQREGRGPLTPASDVYSLGVTVLSALGLQPEEREIRVWSATLMRAGLDARRAARLAELLNQMIAYAPAERPATAQAVLEEARPLQATPGAISTPAAHPPAPPAATRTPMQFSRRRRESTLGPFLVAVVVAAVLGAGAAVLLQNERAGTENGAASSDSASIPGDTPQVAVVPVDSYPAAPDTFSAAPVTGFQELRPPELEPMDAAGRVRRGHWVRAAGFGVRFESCVRRWEEETSYLACTFDIENSGSVEFPEPVTRFRFRELFLRDGVTGEWRARHIIVGRDWTEVLGINRDADLDIPIGSTTRVEAIVPYVPAAPIEELELVARIQYRDLRVRFVYWEAQ